MKNLERVLIFLILAVGAVVFYQKKIKKKTLSKLSKVESIPTSPTATPKGALASNQNVASGIKKPDIYEFTFPKIKSPGEVFRFEFPIPKEEKSWKLSEILYFIRYNWKNERDYVLDEYDCKHFAHQLYLDAQKKQIPVRFVGISMKNSPVGHAINALMSSDHGIVFVDFTPMKTAEGKSIAQKNVVYVAKDEPYLRLPIDYLPPYFSNQREDFYKHYAKGIELNKKLLSNQESLRQILIQRDALEKEQNVLNSDPQKISKEQVAAFQKKVDDFNSSIEAANHNEQVLKDEIRRARNEAWQLPQDENWIPKKIDFMPIPF